MDNVGQASSAARHAVRVQRIVVDPHDLWVRAAAVRRMSTDVGGTRLALPAASSGNAMADAATKAIVQSIGASLPQLAAQLAAVAEATRQAAELYDRVEGAVARD